MKHIILILVILIGITAVSAQDVVINEFLASNDATVADPEGEFDDWVELYNNTDSDISLDGWFLSDDLSEPDKWMLSELTISAETYFIIWTDGDEDQGNDHASFKLSASGEDIVLSDADLNIIDMYSFGTQTTDISMGRFPDITGDFVFMTPSFMLPNTSGSEPEDLSGFLFEENQIQKFDLHFDVENWEDTLTYNYNNGETYMPAQLTWNDSVVLEQIGVRYKGNSSYMQSSTTPKKPFKFHFGKFVDDQLLSGVEKLNFSNCVKDPSFMREVLAYDVIREYVPAPRTSYANIYVDGELLGFYVQVEQVDEIFLNRWFDSASGDLYKAGDDGATMQYRGDSAEDYSAEFEIKTNEDDSDWQDLISFLDVLNNSSDDDFEQLLEENMDVDGALAILAFNMVLSHFDSYTGSSRNYYLYNNPADDKMYLMPWDLNEAFGAYTNNWDVYEQSVFSTSNLSERPLFRRILENTELKLRYIEKIEEMLANNVAYQDMCTKIADLQDLIDPYVNADTNKLYTYNDFLENITSTVNPAIGIVIPGMEEFILSRNENISSQLQSVSVYPGDCDNNQIVNELDILPIGVYFLQEGSPREEVSCSWNEYQAVAWDDPSATYADANGDGTIDEADVIAIGVNWQNSYESTSSGLQTTFTEQQLQEHIESFELIYNCISGSGESSQKIRQLLENSFDFTPSVSELSLSNYPNPFNPETTITFSVVSDQQNTVLAVYNLKGQLIKSLNDQILEKGEYSITWNGTDNNNNLCGSGIYFCRLNNGNQIKSHRILLIK